MLSIFMIKEQKKQYNFAEWKKKMITSPHLSFQEAGIYFRLEPGMGIP